MESQALDWIFPVFAQKLSRAAELRRSSQEVWTVARPTLAVVSDEEPEFEVLREKLVVLCALHGADVLLRLIPLLQDAVKDALANGSSRALVTVIAIIADCMTGPAHQVVPSERLYGSALRTLLTALLQARKLHDRHCDAEIERCLQFLSVQYFEHAFNDLIAKLETAKEGDHASLLDVVNNLQVTQDQLRSLLLYFQRLICDTTKPCSKTLMIEIAENLTSCIMIFVGKPAYAAFLAENRDLADGFDVLLERYFRLSDKSSRRPTCWIFMLSIVMLAPDTVSASRLARSAALRTTLHAFIEALRKALSSCTTLVDAVLCQAMRVLERLKHVHFFKEQPHGCESIRKFLAPLDEEIQRVLLSKGMDGSSSDNDVPVGKFLAAEFFTHPHQLITNFLKPFLDRGVHEWQIRVALSTLLEAFRLVKGFPHHESYLLPLMPQVRSISSSIGPAIESASAPWRPMQLMISDSSSSSSSSTSTNAPPSTFSALHLRRSSSTLFLQEKNVQRARELFKLLCELCCAHPVLLLSSPGDVAQSPIKDIGSFLNWIMTVGMCEPKLTQHVLRVLAQLYDTSSEHSAWPHPNPHDRMWTVTLGLLERVARSYLGQTTLTSTPIILASALVTYRAKYIECFKPKLWENLGTFAEANARFNITAVFMSGAASADVDIKCKSLSGFKVLISMLIGTDMIANALYELNRRQILNVANIPHGDVEMMQQEFCKEIRAVAKFTPALRRTFDFLMLVWNEAFETFVRPILRGDTTVLFKSERDWLNITQVICALGGRDDREFASWNEMFPQAGAPSSEVDALLRVPDQFSLFARKCIEILRAPKSPAADRLNDQLQDILGKTLDVQRFVKFSAELALPIPGSANSKDAKDSAESAQGATAERQLIYLERVLRIWVACFENAPREQLVKFGSAFKVTPWLMTSCDFLARFVELESDSCASARTLFCRLVLATLRNRELLNFTDDIHVRNVLFAKMKNWIQLPRDDLKNLASQRRFVLVHHALAAAAQLLADLPLVKVGVSAEDWETARADLFRMYFLFLMQLSIDFAAQSNIALMADPERRDDGEPLSFSRSTFHPGVPAYTLPLTPNTLRELVQACQRYACLAFFALLSANVEYGFEIALPIAYHESPVIRQIFTEVLSKTARKHTNFSAFISLSAHEDRLCRLVSIVMEPTQALIKVISESMIGDDLDELVEIIFPLYEAYDEIQLLFLRALEWEFAVTKSSTQLFRRPSFATKIWTKGVQKYAPAYLRQVIGPTIARVIEMNTDLEIDLAKNRIAGSVAANVAVLNSLLTECFTSVMNSAAAIPKELIGFCRAIFQAARPADLPMWTSVAGAFFFLRCITPALVSPHMYGVVETVPGMTSLKTLTVISKILQAIANAQDFEECHDLTIITFRTFVVQCIAPCQRFLTNLCELSESRPATARPSHITEPPADGSAAKLNKFLSNQTSMILEFGPRLHGLLKREQATIYQAVLAARTTKTDKLMHIFDSLTRLVVQIGDLASDSVSRVASLASLPSMLSLDVIPSKDALESFRKRRVFYHLGQCSEGSHVIVHESAQLCAGDYDVYAYFVNDILTPLRGQRILLVINYTHYRTKNAASAKLLKPLVAVFTSHFANRFSAITFNPSSEYKKYYLANAATFERLFGGFFGGRLRVTHEVSTLRGWVEPVVLPPSYLLLEKCHAFPNVQVILPSTESQTLTVSVGDQALHLTNMQPYRIFSVPSVCNDVLDFTHFKEVKFQNNRLTIVSCQFEDVCEQFTIVNPPASLVGIIGNVHQRHRLLNANHVGMWQVRPKARPETVPGVLLHIACFNFFSESAELRLAAHRLLMAVIDEFELDVANYDAIAYHFVEVPSNIPLFVNHVCDRVARAHPEMNAEFLGQTRPAFQGATLEQRSAMLTFSAPWVRSLVFSENVQQLERLLDDLITLNLEHSDLVQLFQRNVWLELQSDDLRLFVLEGVLRRAYTQHDKRQLLLDICLALVRKSPLVIPRRLLSELLTKLDDPESQGLQRLETCAQWAEINVLVQLIAFGTFHNTEFVLEVMASLFALAFVFAGTEDSAFSHALYGMLLNAVQSCLIGVPGSEGGSRERLSQLLDELGKPRFRALFRVSGLGADSQAPHAESSNEHYALVVLLWETLEFCMELNVQWPEQFARLISNLGFRGNSVVKTRAISAMPVVRHFLPPSTRVTLLRALAASVTHSDFHGGSSALACLARLTKMNYFSVDQVVANLCAAFVGLSLGDLRWFQRSLDLLEVSLLFVATADKGRSSGGFAAYLLNLISRNEALHSCLERIQQLGSHDFRGRFGFSIVLLILKGLNQPNERIFASTGRILQLLIQVESSRSESDSTPSTFAPSFPARGARETSASASSSISGYLAAMFPFMDPLSPALSLSPSKALTLTCSVRPEDALELLQQPDCADFFLGVLLSLLEHSTDEQLLERILTILRSTLAEQPLAMFAFALPALRTTLPRIMQQHWKGSLITLALDLLSLVEMKPVTRAPPAPASPRGLGNIRFESLLKAADANAPFVEASSPRAVTCQAILVSLSEALPVEPRPSLDLAVASEATV
eukprot:m.716060 g.716060  ORF g.716060 m.716060 type:complete len:2567 (-) comp58793_c0_seq2:178-7878(-)